MFRSEIDLLMYSTFAVRSGESARLQRLTLVFPYVLLWSNRRADHLSKNDSRDDRPPIQTPWKDPRAAANAALRPSHLIMEQSADFADKNPFDRAILPIYRLR